MIEIENPLDAYKEPNGPILLLSGPGTGKTFQLAMRVKFLIAEHGANSEEIAIITFTNEAARNMRERLSHDDIDIPSDKMPGIISTMHSLCNTIVGSNPSKCGLPTDYGVLTDNVRRMILLKDASTLSGFDLVHADEVDDCRRMGTCEYTEDKAKCIICMRYNNILRKCSLLDYDDQITLACKLLSSDDELRDEYQAKSKYLLVDEYQDVNNAQWEFIHILSRSQENGLFAVGDDDQSIYSFRGGSPKYIHDFEEHFGKESKIGRLAKSWRCPENILLGSLAVVENFYKGRLQKPKPTFGEKMQSGNKIKFFNVPSDVFEANLISSIAMRKLTDGHSVTIIIPNGNYLQPIKDSLSKNGLDFNYKGKIDEKGIVRLSVLANWVENKNSNINLRYLIDLIIKNHDDLLDNVDSNSKGIRAKRKTASYIIAKLWDEVTPEKALFQVISSKNEKDEHFAFYNTLKTTCLDSLITLVESDGAKRASLAPFLEKSGLYVAPGINPNRLIREIRELIQDKTLGVKRSTYPSVEIFNMPSAKGLEADVVFVVGLSEGLFPKPNQDIEENSRLLFVAMTRAKKELFLFSARSRPASITYKPESYQLTKSPFIDIIPKDYIEEEYLSKPR